MKKQKTTSKKVSKVLENFKGKFVTIEIKNTRNRLSFGGYLVDEDETYFFLSELPDGPIHAAIVKNEHAGVQLADEMEFLMEQIDVPGDQGVQ